ncbi:MAG: asparagine synthase (glutamine-hydrolyzing) [Lentisphaeria bacterium]
MCGIAGIINLQEKPSSGLLERMGAPLACRGPDDRGWLVRDNCGLEHRRLAIIDPAGGRQPILNEDESLALICNGEVYDFGAWREELKKRGHHFRTGSDNEVLLHLYEEKGEGCLEEVNGMFAFAVFDLQADKVFAARDRFGQKPLFYATAPGRIAIASGPRSLQAIPWVDTDLDYTAIHDFLEYQCIPAPRSIYKGIKKLPPGHTAAWSSAAGLKIRRSTFRDPISRYDVSRAGGSAGTFSGAADELRKRFTAAVERRMVADVPVGVFLSGGMDSGLVCAAAQRLTSQPVKTFSIGFPVAKYDERHEAERVAGYLGTEHHTLEVNPGEAEHLQWLVGKFEEPFCDASMLPMSLLSRFTRGHVKVALSGDGADELFGGYDRYRVMHWLKRWSRLPRSVRRTVQGGLRKMLPRALNERTVAGKLRRLTELLDKEQGGEAYRCLLSRFPAALRREMYGEAMAEVNGDGLGEGGMSAEFEGGDWAAAAMAVDLLTYLPNDILVKVDRASMAHGLEARSPFLDPAVADSALSLPPDWKLKPGHGKHILKKAFTGYLPDATFERGKMGFGVPVAHWLRDGWQEMVRDLLPGGKLVEQGVFRDAALRRMIDEHCMDGYDRSYPLFAILVLELWLRDELCGGG